MDLKKLKTLFKSSSTMIIDERHFTVCPDPDLEACIGIMNKPHQHRSPQEIELFANRIAGLEIFGRSLLENLDPKTMIQKLMPYMKPEIFPAGKPIFHYEQPSDKLYIIMRGKAKEFIPKGIDEIEQESQYKFGGGFQYLQGVPSSLSEIGKNENPPPVSPKQGQPATYSSLNTISEETEEKDPGTSELTKKRLRKLKAVIPFLAKLNTNKNATQNAEEYRYKKVIKKPRSIMKPLMVEEGLLEGLEKEFGCYIVDEFKKYPKAYFIGGLLKVRFSKFLEAGSHCGLRALRDNSLRSRAVFAEDDCYCISLHREDFIKVLENEKALNIDKIEFFKNMFNMIDDKSVIEFSLLWENHPCKLNDVLYQQGSPSNYLYVLCSGEVTLSKTISENTKPKPAITADLPYRVKRKGNPNERTLRVATVCSGDFFGEKDFFEEMPREFTASVTSTKAKVYKLQHEKYKNLCKNYSDIMKEIRRMMNLKVDWKKERIEELCQRKIGLEKDKKEVSEARLEQERTLISLGLLSPDKPSSKFLKIKIIDKMRLTLPNRDKVLKYGQSFEELPIVLREKTLESTTKELSKELVSENEDDGLFSRTRIPRQYDPKCENMIKQSIDKARFSFRDDEPIKRPSSKVPESHTDIENRKSRSSSRGRGILSIPSLKSIKRKFLKSRMTVEAGAMSITDIEEDKDIKRAPSIEFDIKDPTPRLNKTSETHSLNEKYFKQSLIGPFITTPIPSSTKLFGSSERIEHIKSDKGSLSTIEPSSRQTVSKGIIDIGSLNTIGEELYVKKVVKQQMPKASPIHSNIQSRNSLKTLRLTLRRQESKKTLNESTQQSIESIMLPHKPFRVSGERTGTVGSRTGAQSVKNFRSSVASGIYA